MPKTGKNRTQQPPNGLLPEENPCKKCEGVGHAHIGAAQPEGKKQPAVQGGKDEETVRKERVLRSQGAQKAVYDAKRCAGQQPQREAHGGKGGRGHRKNLPSQPWVSRGSS